MAERSRWAPGAAVLADAARAVAAVAWEGRSTEEALGPYDQSAQRSAVRAIALGSLRWFLRLLPAVDSLLSRPKDVADEIRALLVVSCHQVEYSRNPPQVTAHAAVDATRILRQGRASGLVNAVLRKFVSERASLLARVDGRLAARTAHPQWLVQMLERAWPDSFKSILDANNAHPPLVLRVDLTRTSRTDYMAQLAAAGIEATLVDWCDSALQVTQPVPVAQLPGFADGLVSVQDAGAQLAAILLDAQPGMRVLDACAAPGGKTGHILERTPDLAQVVAVDVDESRVARIRENLQRLHRSAQLEVMDLREPGSLAGQKFDRILVDAPCSSTGVIRRHPDIKLLRRQSDIANFATTQEQILGTALSLLAPGGRVLYCTCSVFPAENEAVVEKALATASDVRVVPPALPLERIPGAVARTWGLQLVPGAQAGTDGFYYACLEKTTAGT